jgi:hypothetical protein
MYTRKVANAAGWRTIAIFAGFALLVAVTIIVSVSVYKGNQVRTITRSHLMVGNDTAWYGFTNVARVGVKQLCFSNDTYNYPECTTYDGRAGCIDNGGHNCFNDVTIYGKLSIAESGALENVSFRQFSIGDYSCIAALDGNVYCSGSSALYANTLGLTIYFDPDKFASLSRNGSTLVITAPKLAIAAVVTGTTHFEGPILFDERLVLDGNGVIQHIGDRIQILGRNLTEFLDSVIIRGTTSMFGRIIEPVTLDTNIGIDMYGTHTYLTQHDGDLDVCATTGIATICGLNVSLTGTNGIRFTGPVVGDVHLINNLLVDGHTIFANVTITNDLNLVNLAILGTLDVYGVTRLHNLLSIQATTETWHLLVDYIATLNMVYLGNDTNGIFDVGRGALTIVRGPAMFRDGMFVDGSSWPLNTSTFAVSTTSISLAADSLGTSITSLGWTNLTGSAGMCMGLHSISSQNPNERCGIYIDSNGCTNISCLHVNNLIFDHAEVDRFTVNNEFCGVRLSTNLSLPADERCAIYSNSSNTVYAGDVVADSLRLGTISGQQVTSISTDGTLSGNSDSALATQRAVKTYVDSRSVSSSFNLTFTIIYASPLLAVIPYERTGLSVSLLLPDTTAAATSSGHMETGPTSLIPASIRPTTQQCVMVFATDNSVQSIGRMCIAPSGQVDVGLLAGSGDFSGSGTSGFSTTTVTYILR